MVTIRGARQFASSDFDASISTANDTFFTKRDSSNRLTSQYAIITPFVSGVPLSYVRSSSWSTFSYSDTSTRPSLIIVERAVGGVPTKAGDLPLSGSASYDTTVAGSLLSQNKFYNFSETGTGASATFTVNFATGAITSAINLVALESGSTTGAPNNFGTLNGTASLTSGGPGFTGTIAGASKSGISGAFFGPQALEFGYVFNAEMPTFVVNGRVFGAKAGTITPPPAGTYTPLADLTGDRTFQSAGVQYNTAPSGISGGTSQNFGNGVTIAYTAATDSYLLAAPSGASFNFTPAMVQPPSAPNQLTWVNVTGTQRNQLLQIVPTSSSGVPFSYTVLGSWGQFDTTTNLGTIRLAVGGVPTLGTDMPRTGSATYSAGTGGTIVSSGTVYNLQGNSTMNFAANFADNSVTLALFLAGIPANTNVGPAINFGPFNGFGSISANTSSFSGTLSGTGATGLFSGAFFGPQAQEMGMAWYLNGATISGAGLAAGVKQ